MAKYNGHINWAYWNVSLYINSEEDFYRMAAFTREHYRKAGTPGQALEHAARHYIGWLKDQGITETPDGATFTLHNVKAAMRDL